MNYPFFLESYRLIFKDVTFSYEHISCAITLLIYNKKIIKIHLPCFYQDSIKNVLIIKQNNDFNIF